MENFDINLLGEALDFEELSKIPPAIFKKIQVFCDFYFGKFICLCLLNKGSLTYFWSNLL